MRQTGNMPNHQYARAAANWVPGVGPYNQVARAVGMPYQHHPISGTIPYQPQYYGPPPPTSSAYSPQEATEAGHISTRKHSPTQIALAPTPVAPFMYNHPPQVYSPQNHYYHQFYQQNYHIPTGQSSTSDDINKVELNERRGTERNENHYPYDRHASPSDHDDGCNEPSEHDDGCNEPSEDM
jgi:hypothetical protein